MQESIFFAKKVAETQREKGGVNMLLKIIAIIVASVTSVRAIVSFDRGRYADMTWYGLAALTICQLGKMCF